MNTQKYLNYVIDNKVLYKLSLLLLFIIIAMVFLGVDPAHAASGDSSKGMPWEGPLGTIADSLSGPVAFSIALIGMVVCGGMLVFGGELGDFSRRMIMLVLAVSVMMMGTKVLSSIFGVGGAVIL